MESNNDFREVDLLEEMEKEFENNLEEFVDFDDLTKNYFQIALRVAIPILVKHIHFFRSVVCLDYLVSYD